MLSVLLALLVPTDLLAADLPAATATTPTVLLAPPTTQGPLDGETVVKGVQGAESAVLACLADPAHPLPLDLTTLPATWAVLPDGRVDRVVIRGLESLPDHQGCLAAALMNARFPTSAGETMVSTRFSLSGPSSLSGHLNVLDLDSLFRSTPTPAVGGVVVAQGTTVGGDLGSFGSSAAGRVTVPAAPDIVGDLDRSLVEAVVKRNMAQIRYCYQRELVRKPSLQGEMRLRLVIDAGGAVSSATVEASTLENAALEGCIPGRFMHFVFPEPKGGGSVTVIYSFHFEP